MTQEPILNPESVFGDAPAVQTRYMGRSAFAVIMASIVSLFIITPLGLLLGAGSNLAVFPELATTEDEYLGGLIFLIFGAFILAGTLLGMFLNKFRNYATNIMGIVYLIMFILGFALVAGIYLIAGPAALA